MRRLYKSLNWEYNESAHHTNYYALIDILKLADQKDSTGEFTLYLNKHFYPVDFVHCLAIDRGSVWLPGYGFFRIRKG